MDEQFPGGQQVGALILPQAKLGSAFGSRTHQDSGFTSFPLQDTVVISRLSMEIIPPVFFAPELVQESTNQNRAEGPFVIHQNQFRVQQHFLGTQTRTNSCGGNHVVEMKFGSILPLTAGESLFFQWCHAIHVAFSRSFTTHY